MDYFWENHLFKCLLKVRHHSIRAPDVVDQGNSWACGRSSYGRPSLLDRVVDPAMVNQVNAVPDCIFVTHKRFEHVARDD